MAIERVCVVGGGVIGSLYAAHLARRAEVTVLTRREEHARALNEHGLRVSGKGDFTAELAATNDPAAPGVPPNRPSGGNASPTEDSASP